MTKILYLHHAMHQAGGIQRIITEKANYLAENGIEVCLLSKGARREDFFSLNPRVKRIFLNLSENSTPGHFQDKLSAFLFDQKFSTVVAIMYAKEMEFLPKIKDGSQKILEYHTSFAFAKGFTSLMYKPFQAITERLAFQKFKKNASRFDRFIVLTEEDANDWRKHLKNVEVIPNFISKFPEGKNFNKKNKAIAVGRLEGVKQFDKLIDSWKLVQEKLPEWELHIFGDGPLKKPLQDKINTLNLQDSVVLKGNETDSDKIYGDAKLLVSTSSYEGLPMVFLEAMSYGLPIISFNFKTGVKDLVEEGTTGFIVPKNNIAELAKKIVEFAENESIFSDLGKNALQKAHNFSKEGVMKKWISIFAN